MHGSRLLRAALMMAVAFPFALDHVADAAYAQSQDLGTVAVSGGAKPAPRKKVKQTRAPRANATRQAAQTAAPAVVPLTSDAAIGSGAPAGSAPALAPSQGSLNSFQPTSIVSDKIIKDVVKVGADYNETAKYTPGFVSNNANGIGDSKSGWRGYQDGQFNITFDGIPFGDANDPSHHSAAYFPASFLSRVTVDRGPGAASQFGYATFGGTLGLNSLELSDKEGSMSFCIAINIATAAMEEIYERLCWIYITVKNTLVYDRVGNTYHLSDLTELSEGRIPYLEQFTDKLDYEQKSLLQDL